MAKDVGAKKVIVASCAPPIRYSNVYGIDMPTPTELVAHGRTTEEIAEHIGADLVIFQTLPDLIKSCNQFNPAIEQFDCSVFTGEYITGGVDERYLEHLEKIRSDNAKLKKASKVGEAAEISAGCSGPMSECCCVLIAAISDKADGSDSLIGLSNHSPKLGPTTMSSPISEPGLHNSWFQDKK